MKVEVCAYSLESCLNAQQAGADRVELCGGLGEGGTTPSAGLIAAVRENIQIDLYVMIRPRGGDFVYDESEMDVMRRDIDIAKSLGADGLVLGVSLPDGKVDVARTRELVQYAQPLGVTFHRAFDLTPDPFSALESVIETGCERILTSGQKPTAPQGAALLTELVKQANGRIEIMAGGGVSSASAAQLAAAGVNALHLTGKAFRPGRQTYFPAEISMAGEIPDERSVLFSDPERVAAVVRLVS
ncbi:copper homeostasis protein CutC [Persicitalea jodogahamensis]|uniref:PF03932 family protein CutC n=1 Tax=Persicitalea jodogahamensis TaxID=402147 RepID=A0A8J3D592_9BACT|nr:copper homeostasis protein CutC [Persicitalea jodogahamensis]GHB85133.1 copper homeostasis protein CutC [Persicitalea jodogahamensis]